MTFIDQDDFEAARDAAIAANPGSEYFADLIVAETPEQLDALAAELANRTASLLNPPEPAQVADNSDRARSAAVEAQDFGAWLDAATPTDVPEPVADTPAAPSAEAVATAEAESARIQGLIAQRDGGDMNSRFQAFLKNADGELPPPVRR